MTGSMSQPISLTGGLYTLGLKARQRSGNATYQQVRVSLMAGTNLVASTKQFVWNGTEIGEERDANNVVTRRFYPQGEQIGGVSYYYTRDHLGSVREMTDSTGAVRASYYYDPYGYRTKQSGDLEASFGFTGHYFHQPSSLSLTLYRAYDSITGRWLSRDPIGERGGLNLYGYVLNNPIDRVDPLGLDAYLFFSPNGGPAAAPGAGHVGVGVDDGHGGVSRSDAAWGDVGPATDFDSLDHATLPGDIVVRLPNHATDDGPSSDSVIRTYLRCGRSEQHLFLYCSNYASDVARAGGWDWPGLTPNVMLDAVRASASAAQSPTGPPRPVILAR